MKGKILQWKDDKGFGFILPEKGGEKLFFHISSIKNQSRHPQVGDAVLYDSERDAQGRLRAKSVVLEGVASKPGGHISRSIIHTEPVKKNTIDYISILVAVLSIAVGMFVFYTTYSIEKLVPVGILLVISIVVLNRQKRPKEKRFSCARCKKAENHSKRTIRVWNKGITKLYCGSCHKKWLRENPTTYIPTTYFSSRGSGSGCLGVVVLLVLIPITIGMAVYEWLI
ncbi:cold-shock DNA-binding domain family protein [Beggiatoa sp. PS]|nr:cold-shock DNA-binding domain family protein [Beggiatoa sp. PS]